jgi:hypothetical protein
MSAAGFRAQRMRDGQRSRLSLPVLIAIVESTQDTERVPAMDMKESARTRFDRTGHPSDLAKRGDHAAA